MSTNTRSRTVWGAKITGLTSDYQSTRCPACRRRKTPIVRIGEPIRYGRHEVRPAVRIGGEAAVCTNPHCPRYTDLSRVPTWRP
jgi:hypothetical protein